MRLHRLTVTAFGPFAGTETVDFDALGVDGLFLVHGDTGAGKTTVLDAVAFALFGRVPGARGEARRLRSDHADPDSRPSVELELTVGGARVVVHRSPDWTRPKKRGAGTTLEKSSASLHWVDGSGREPVTRHEEVARIVERLVGMTAEQFTQVVLLPQGDFARFLRAETDERERLLEQLFGTARFGRVEAWFRARRMETRRAVDAGEAALDQLAARLSQVAGVGQPAAVDAGWLDSTGADLDARARVAATTADHATRLVTARTAELADARTRAELVRRARALSDRTAALDRAETAVHAARHELDAARRVRPVAAAVEDARHAESVAEATRRAADTAVAALVRDGVLPAAAQASWAPTRDDLAEAANARRHEAGRLDGLVTRLAAARAEEDLAARLGIDLAVTQPSLDQLARRREQLPAELASARAAVTEADAAATGLGHADADEVSARAAVDAARRRDALVAGRPALADAQAAARADAATARERWLDLRELRLAGMAAELAADLAPGSPCPVCGNTQHPVTARPAGDRIAEVDEEAARVATDAGAERLAAATAAVADLDAGLAAVRAVAHDRPVAELAADLRACAATRARLTGLADQRSARASALATAEADAAQTETQWSTLLDVRARAVTELDGLGRARMSLATEAELARGSDPDVPARRQRLLAEADAADAARTAAADAAAAAGGAAERTGRAIAEAARAGFAHPAAAHAARRSDAALVEVDRKIRAFENERAAVASAAADPDLAGVDPEERVDLDGPGTAAAAAEQLGQRAIAGLALTEQAATLLAALAQEWTDAALAHAPVRGAFDELAALTDVLDGRGQNAEGLSLRSYVLASRLDEVAAAASDRLAAMTTGRYALTRGAGAGRRGTAGGLGIDVIDTWTGVTRPAKTLSGGESFLASLSLALALADVVSAEAGGVVMDTLFVDEGFGALDPDTLELVMTTLDELRAGGRVVGLVSHVADLYDRIPTRLHVRKTRTGSALHQDAA